MLAGAPLVSSLTLLLLFCVAQPLAAQSQPAAPSAAEATLKHPTDFRSRVEIRNEYQDLEGDGYLNLVTSGSLVIQAHCRSRSCSALGPRSSALFISGYPAVPPMARNRTFLEIGHLDLAQVVGRNFVALRIHVDVEDPRRIQPEDLLLHVGGER